MFSSTPLAYVKRFTFLGFYYILKKLVRVTYNFRFTCLPKLLEPLIEYIKKQKMLRNKLSIDDNCG